MNSTDIFIPDEVLLKILKIVAKRNFCDLYNLLTLNKRWNKLVTFTLYNSIHFRTYNQRISFLKGLLSNNDELFKKRKEVELDYSLYEKEYNDYLNVECQPIPTKYIEKIKKINFCLSPNEIEEEESDSDDTSSSDTNKDAFPSFKKLDWSQRCVNASLNIISIYCDNLISLNLSGCQFYDYIFVELIEKCRHIRFLDVSNSSIKQMGLLGIIENVSREEDPLPLQEINLSGIFRFWRLFNEMKFFPSMVKNARNLQKMIIMNCPDIPEETIEECLKIKNSLNIVTDHTVKISELFLHKESTSNITRQDSSMTLGANNEIYI